MLLVQKLCMNKISVISNSSVFEDNVTSETYIPVNMEKLFLWEKKLFLFGVRTFCTKLVCQLLDHLHFHIHIKGKFTDKGK